MANGWQVQDPATGVWVPFPENDAATTPPSRGNVKGPDGTVYAHDMGQEAYGQQPAAGGGASTFDPAAFQQVVGRPPTAEETAYYSTRPGWLDEVKANTPAAAAPAPAPDPGAGAPPPPPNPTAPPPTGGPPPSTYAPPTAGYGAAPAPGAPSPGVGSGGGGLIQEYPGGPFVPPEMAKGPAYVAPTYTAPTYQSAMEDPGYQFAQEEGQKGVERSAAARGVLNSGGTLQDIARWNQALATTQYQNVADRALQSFQTNAANDKAAYDINYKTQYEDPYRNAYQSAWDKWSAGYGQWKDRINISKDITTL